MSKNLLVAQVMALQSELVSVKAESKAEVSTLENTIANLVDENSLLKRRLFGNKTEKSKTVEAQLIFNDMLAKEAELQKALAKAIEETAKAAGQETSPQTSPKPPRAKPTGRRDLLASNLPRHLVEIIDEAREAEGCRRIGFEESQQLMFRRGGFSVLVKRVAKYEVIQNGLATVCATPNPESLFPRGLLHTSTVAHILMAKFALGVPHYRLEQSLVDQGVPLDRGTMGRYVEHAGNTLGATIVAAMWQDAKANAFVMSTDATGAAIQPVPRQDGLRQACKKAHFFTVVVDARAVLFFFAERHTSEFVSELFSGFTGYLQSDASSVYDILERGPPADNENGLRLVGCFAHLRRYFFEAAICHHPAGLQGLLRIRAIYAAERLVMKAPATERVALRAAHVRPLVEQLFAWTSAEAAITTGRNLATKALGYANNQQIEFLRVLDDPKLPLDNTRSERALRKIVVGRKNWMFYGSDTHAEAAAAIFSLIASCRLNGIDPHQYFDEILRVVPYWPSDRYLELAPHNWLATRALLVPAELDAPIAAFTIPPRPVAA